MVKKGGTKRKPVMTKIANKASRATTFTKRRDGLYSKAAQLCVITDAQIAILATPSSSNSNTPFFSFGHSSVESVVSAYLSGQRLAPVSTCDNTKATREDLGICMARKDLGLGFWWDDDKLVNSNDPEELMEAMESMKVLQSHLKRLEDQTLTTTTTVDEDMVEISPESDEWSEMDLHKLLQDCDCDDVPPLHDVVSNTEEDHNVSEQTCNNNNFVSLPELDEWSEMVLNQLLEDCDHVPEHQNVSEETCNNNNFVSLPELDEWSEMVLNQLLEDCDHVPEPPVFGNTDQEEEDHNVSEKTCNNFVSLPEAVVGSLEEEAMNIDWDTVFASGEELLSDEYKMYV
ncbi:agamous-like MADS-box protein AGL97 [Raphanus sativus]|uniref:Agamous-like MADS-box protein AGL97 n=1 Tax=Raphanus sativus TaxID=3726 RepID=A0A6J0NCF0_RAPSA|nr:agamous-like MADS-box protein AGL97 [Raphanus sativus]KAJ4902268.1 agamous-like MADS-box protein AGL97 [Raphanus sativus]